MSIGRRWSAAVLVALLGLGTVLLWAAPAQAHSELSRSDPPAGGLVAEGRTELSLWFVEGIYPQASSFGLHTVDGDPVEVAIDDSADGSDGYARLETPPLERGIYVLDWQALSREDGHTTGGSILFGAGVRPDAVTSGAREWPGWATLSVRLLDLVAITVAVGALAVSGRVLRGATVFVPGARRRALRIGAVAALLGVLSATVTPFLRTPRGAGAFGPWLRSVGDSLIGTQWGWWWILHGTGLLAAGVLLLLAARRPDGVARSGAAVALLAVVVSDSVTGHASDLVRGSSETTAATTVHLVTAGTWAGSLAILAVCLLPTMRRRPESRRRLLLGTWHDFSPVAAVSAGLLLASGLYMAGRQVPELPALQSTLYGLALTGKTLALAVVLVVAAMTTLAVNPRIAARVADRLRRPAGWTPVSRSRFQRLVAAEIGILGVALVLAALMTSAPSSRTSLAAGAVTAPRTATVDGLFITFEQVPAGAGDSRIIVRASAVTRPQPGPVAAADVMLVAPDERTEKLDLREIEPGRFEGTTPSPTPGDWQAWVAIVRPGVPDAVAQVAWTVAPSSGSVVSPLEKVATTLAVLVALGIAVAAGGWVLQRRRDLPSGRFPSSEEPPGDGTERDRVTVGVHAP